MHPNLLGLEGIHTAEDLVGRFRHNPLYHIGHLIVTFAVPVIIVVMVGTMNILQGTGKKWGFWGGIIGVFGAFILAVDKGSLCLVNSAFDTLPDDHFTGLIPYLQVLVDKSGLLVILWLLSLLTIGGMIQAWGLVKERVITKWQGFLIITGLLLLNNPDIDLIGAIGSITRSIGYIPWGIKELRGHVIM